MYQRKRGEEMNITISGDAKEIAALVLQLQERQTAEPINPEKVASSMRDTLLKCREKVEQHPPFVSRTTL